jgi:hypothetical protein
MDITIMRGLSKNCIKKIEAKVLDFLEWIGRHKLLSNPLFEKDLLIQEFGKRTLRIGEFSSPVVA